MWLYWLIINLFLAFEVHGNYRRLTGREDARVWVWGVCTLIFGIFAAVMYLLARDEYRAQRGCCEDFSAKTQVDKPMQ